MNNTYINKKSNNVLELGSSPGGWSQVASKIITKGKILAVDIKFMEKINNVEFIKGDFTKNETQEKIKVYFDHQADVVLSDMAANTTGNKSLDAYRTGELCLEAMGIATKILRKDGIFLSKIFMGSIFKDIDEMAKKYFNSYVLKKNETKEDDEDDFC